jgi:hypothetical protein
MDLDAELRKFEEEERKRLGLESKTEQWIEDMANLTFTKTERSKITMLVSGLTMAHDYFVEGGLKGVGYNVQMLDCPDVAALQYGKEFGNRGQCNPTYFTVGCETSTGSRRRKWSPSMSFSRPVPAVLAGSACM